ncbi:MAG: methylmalonyl-CoA mutase family protein [Bacteroidia bacterium]|nr:methylmalonyl-CoA mutase family protein [Bacteroidia bacterium]
MNFFFCIAYFRAAQKLRLQEFRDFACQIAGYTSSYNESEPYSNLIRGALQSAAMTIGGCDEIEILPINLTREGYRWAGNTFHLLNYESHINQTLDPSFGSEIVERLTDSILEKVYAEPNQKK